MKKKKNNNFPPENLKILDKTTEGNFYENLIINHYSQSIEEITLKIDSTDEIVNPSALKELFHKYGLNMRFEWIVYSKLRNAKFLYFLLIIWIYFL